MTDKKCSPLLSERGSEIVGCSCGEFTPAPGDVEEQWANHSWGKRVTGQLRALGANHKPRSDWEVQVLARIERNRRILCIVIVYAVILTCLLGYAAWHAVYSTEPLDLQLRIDHVGPR